MAHARSSVYSSTRVSQLIKHAYLVWLCRQQVEKKTVLENLDLVLLAMDEIVDGG